MNNTAQQIVEAAKSLSTSDRVELIERLLDTLNPTDRKLDGLWAKEAEDRLAAYQRGEIEAVGLAEAMAKYKSK